ncbi:hypothetical protein EV647_2540 [Kribbella sp. VKM Ac-2566]|nr:hypothetical protein EV647_2540 [Kribbella sp. VKM Ac-2566]
MYDATAPCEVDVTCHTGRVTREVSGHGWCGRDPRKCVLAGACRAADVTRNITSALPMDSLTIHGAPFSTPWGSTVDPGARPHWAVADSRAGSGSTMTRAAVIAPRVRPQRCCVRRQVRAAGVGTDRRPQEDKRPPGSLRGPADAGDGGTGTVGGTGRNRSHRALLLIGLTIGDATFCTPSGTASDGTEVRGHRCAGIETQPKQAPLTRQPTQARIGTAARRRSGGPSPGCWTSILAHDCAEMVARW